MDEPVTAAAVAAELRRRLPGIGLKKQHKLLYYCQGQHLVAFGRPLFPETISAWDMGPVVGRLWHDQKTGQAQEAGQPRSEAALNTIGYVISHYGGLTANELERLTHSEPPWAEADEGRRPGTSVRIENDAIRRWFTLATQDVDSQDVAEPDGAVLDAWLRQVRPYDPDAATVEDSPEELRARLV